MFGIHHAFAGLLIGNTLKEKNIGKGSYNNELIILASVLGSISPDFDIIFNFIGLNHIGHKTLTHSFFFFIIISLALFYFNKKFFKNKFKKLVYIFSFGYLTHLFLDFIVGGKIYLYWFSETNNHVIQNTNLLNWYNFSGNLFYITIGLLIFYMFKTFSVSIDFSKKTFINIMILLLIFISVIADYLTFM